MTPDDVDLEKALELLALPREVGLHPEDGEPIVAGIGRFGPFVKHGGPTPSQSRRRRGLDVGMNRAVELLAEAKRAGRGRGGEAAARARRPPRRRGAVVLSGRYGPYVKHGATNANVPRDPSRRT